MASSDQVVHLNGGVVVRLDALLLALDLEMRGFRLHVRDDGRLQVAPAASLTPDDVTAIRLHRDALLTIAGYVAPLPAWAQ